MSSKIDQIIDISIGSSTTTVTQAGFGTEMILGEGMKLSKRVKSYSNIAEVLLDFSETDVEYLKALATFSQELTPPTVFIGKKVTKGSTAIISATNPEGNIVTLTATGIGTEAELGATVSVAGFVETEFNGSFEVTSLIDENSIQYNALTTPSSTPATGSGTYSLSETWTNAEQKCFNYNPRWYAISITSNTEADILEIAAKTEVLKRIFFARTSDVDNLDVSEVDSVMYKLKALNYDRTVTTYNADTVTKFIDSAWLGRMLPTVPGSANWAFQTLTGVTADNLLSSQSGEEGVFGNNGNTYENISGNSITRYGTASSGEFIDIIRGADWLQARLQEVLLYRLIEAEKIPLTNSGGAIIENDMRSILDIAVANGFLASDTEGKGLYTIFVPRVTDIPLTDRVKRFFSMITFEAQIAGAVNKIGIKGNLSI